MPHFRAAFDRATLAFLAVLIALTATRVSALFYSPIGLDVDEAQYWTWSRSLEWGYFTKPPLVAWVIAATTAMFGDAEWAVRLGAPLAHAVAASVIFALGRAMYGAWPALWAGVGWLLLPGVFFSSNIISTDTLLLPLWAIALFSMWRLMNTRAWLWAIVVGVAVGFGTLAKYAMLYFFVCTAVAAWWMPPIRAALAKGRGWVAALIALAIVTPNIVWNARHEFATARHTASNARLGSRDLFNLDELFEFLGNQFLVFGVVMFAVLIWLLWRAWRRSSGLQDQDKFLIAYMLPPLAFVSLIAFISRANANWAAVAFPAIVLWVTGSLIATRGGQRVLGAALTLNLAFGVAVLAAPFDLTFSNQFKNVRNARSWEETARQIAVRAIAQPGDPPFTAVMVDDRTTFFELSYYWRHARRAGMPLPPLRMWRLYEEAHNSAEATDPMRPEEGGRVLVVHLRPGFVPFVAGDFTAFRTIENLTVPLGGGYTRPIEISVGEGFSPAPRDEAFLRRLTEEDD
jgi:4-amino-4-deoxy-L-arabinose transferase-like glycosyltransferase